jgi:hypothetical protein
LRGRKTDGGRAVKDLFALHRPGGDWAMVPRLIEAAVGSAFTTGIPGATRFSKLAA